MRAQPPSQERSQGSEGPTVALIPRRTGRGDGAAVLCCAFEHAGLEVREVTAEEAEADLDRFGIRRCVLVADWSLLEGGASSAGWGALAGAHPDLAVVAIGWGTAPEGLRRAFRGARRCLLESPFDPAAIVAAARRAVVGRPARVRHRAHGRRAAARPAL